MSTIQKQIRDAVFAKLQAIPGVATVHRSPRRVLAEAELPAICLFSHGDKVVDDSIDQSEPHERCYTLRIEIRAAGRPEEDATDAFAVAVRQALLPDNTLGGMANRIVWTDQLWDGSEDDSPLAGAALDFNVFYLWRPE